MSNRFTELQEATIKQQFKVLRMQRIPAAKRIQLTESGISCIATDACYRFVLRESLKAPVSDSMEPALRAEGPVTETMIDIVRDWPSIRPKDHGIDSRIAIDLCSVASMQR